MAFIFPGLAKLGYLIATRYASAIPLAIVTLAGAGAAVGSFSISRTAAGMLSNGNSADRERQPWTAAMASAAAGVAAVSLRELVDPPVRRPRVPAPPPNAGSLAAWRYAASEAAMSVAHYPLKHRIVSLFLAGTVAGVAYALTEFRPAPSAPVQKLAGHVSTAPSNIAALPPPPEDSENGAPGNDKGGQSEERLG